MATQIKRPAGRLYDEDFYAWSKTQADLLRTAAMRISTWSI